MKPLLLTLVSAIVLSTALANAAQNPTPLVNQPLVPASVAPGGPDFTLTVNGTGFVSGSTVNWNGSPRATTFVSGSQLTVTILSTDIATASTASVTVSSPAPGGGVSNVVFLPVRSPATFVSLNSTSFGTQLNPYLLATGDFNQDGRQDIAVGIAGSAPGISIFLGNGDGTFSQGDEYSLLGTSPSSIVAADIDDDGNPDLVVSDNNRGLIVLLGNGDGMFENFVEFPSPQQLQGLAISDFNRDGILDVEAVWVNGICTFLGSGFGTFQSPSCVEFSTPDFSGITSGDFNADGNLDLALSGDGGVVAILLGRGNGTFQQVHAYQVPAFTYSPITADFNGDGKLDLALVLANSNSVLVYLGNGDGSFQSPSPFETALGPETIAAFDMNGDGKLDIIAGALGFDAASVSILFGNEDGTFQNHVDYDGLVTSGLVISDFNNDGRLDVAVSNYLPGTITVLVQDDGSVVRLSANKLTFPTQLVNTVSDPKLIILTNTGADPVKVSNITTTSNFSQLNNCKTVQPGKSCKIAVFFTPTAPGDLVGYMAITDDGGGSPQIVNLTGTATVVSFSPSKLDFGSLPVGKVSTPQNVILTNEGNASLGITGIGIGGHDAKDFFQVNACPSKLPAGASCTITVIFHPSAQGTRNATLGVKDNGGGSPQKVPLSGTGT